ncbi:MAG TPA: TolC family protein [Bryobacteraceae bacterium]|nr:TolC family protein [Bryobacteraceae bacterium]
MIAALLLVPMLQGASLLLPGWVERRFYPETVRIRDVEGLDTRITDGKLTLHLRDFLELALLNSTDIHIARMDVYTAANQVLANRAIFDTALNLGFTAIRSVSPQTSQIGGASTLSSLNQNSFISMQQVLPTGQTFSSTFSSARNSTNSAFNLFNPSISGNLGFTFLQPLLQNRNGIQFRAPQEIARTQLTITSRQSEARIADLIAAAAGQYWDAVRSRDNIKVQLQTLELAKKSYDRDKQALDLGALAALDIFQSETQVAERQRDLVQAQYAYRLAVDNLRRLIGADLTPELRRMEIELADDPSVAPPDAIVLGPEEALEAALRIRPEMDAVHRRLTIDDLNARVARNLMTPRLDLSIQGSGVGLGGNKIAVSGPLGIVSPAAPGGLGDTLSQVLGFNSPTYGAGIQLSIPTRSTAARAQLSDALVARTRDLYAERQVGQQIAQDVRQALNSISLATAAIEAGNRARDLARRNVDAAQQKYELGTITAFELLDSQSRLATAESALLNSHVGYQQAWVSYQRATWTLLDRLGMVLETPRVK